MSPCSNLGLPVFTQRITIGDSTLRRSDFGDYTGAKDADGNISNSVYLKDGSAQTAGFEAVLGDAVQRATGTAPTPPAQAQGESSYVAEVFFKYPDIGFLGWSTAGGAYARFIFR